MLKLGLVACIAAAQLMACSVFSQNQVEIRLCSEHGRMSDITIYETGWVLLGDVLESIERCTPDAECMSSPFPLMRPPEWPPVRTTTWRQGSYSFEARMISNRAFEILSDSLSSRYRVVYDVEEGVREIFWQERIGRTDNGEGDRLTRCAGRLTFDSMPRLLSAADKTR